MGLEDSSSPLEFKTVSAHPLTGGIKLRPHRDIEASLTALGGRSFKEF